MTILLLILAALGDVHALAVMDQTRRQRVASVASSNASDARIFTRTDHTAVVDSLIPDATSSKSVMPSDHEQLTTTAIAIVLAFLGLCTIIAIMFFIARYIIRRAAIKRRRQASWILRSGQWNMEPKRMNAHETRTGCSDTSSSFTAYPYPLSEHF